MIRCVALLMIVAAAMTVACGDDDGPRHDAAIDVEAGTDAATDAATDASDAAADSGTDATTPGDLDATAPDADLDAGDGGAIAREPGLTARPSNTTCVAWPTEAEPPQLLSLTGCFDPEHPGEALPAMIPFEPIAKLWSDSADKRRWLAIPDGTTIQLAADGDFALPVGTVLAKTFALFARNIETRLLVHHADGIWRGYAYEWNEAQTDAVLLGDTDYLLNGKSLLGLGNGQQDWTIPSRTQCDRCHTSIAGNSIGLEVAQLNSDLAYPATGRTANQLATLDAIGMFDVETPLSGPVESLPRLSPFTGNDPLAARARSYLHVNCSMCHRAGGQPSCTGDFRFQTPEKDMGVCNATPLANPIWSSDVRLIKPGNPDISVIALRMRAPKANDAIRMPPLGTEVLDHQGINIVEAWIRNMESCPQ